MTVADPILTRRPESRVWKKFRTHKSAMLGGVLVTFFVLIALLAPILPVPDPAATLPYAHIFFRSRNWVLKFVACHIDSISCLAILRR